MNDCSLWTSTFSHDCLRMERWVPSKIFFVSGKKSWVFGTFSNLKKKKHIRDIQYFHDDVNVVTYPKVPTKVFLQTAIQIQSGMEIAKSSSLLHSWPWKWNEEIHCLGVGRDHGRGRGGEGWGRAVGRKRHRGNSFFLLVPDIEIVILPKLSKQ